MRDHEETRSVPCPPSEPKPEPKPEACPVQPPCESEKRPGRKQAQHRPVSAMPAGSFLRQLLPKDLDTGDLIVILLLLLMAGDCREEQNTAMLTLALYLFM